MAKGNNLSDSLSITIKESNLQNVTTDLVKVAFDSILEDSVLKDLPIVGSIIGVAKAAVSINDKLFLKKVIYFLSAIDVDPIERSKIITKIENSEKYKIKVGEKLLYIIDKSEDHISANYIAQLFNAFLKKKVRYSDFLRGSKIIENVFIEDFKYFLNTPDDELTRMIKKDIYSITFAFIENNLITSGLLKSQTLNTSGDKQFSKVDVIRISITHIGRMFKENLKPL